MAKIFQICPGEAFKLIEKQFTPEAKNERQIVHFYSQWKSTQSGKGTSVHLSGAREKLQNWKKNLFSWSPAMKNFCCRSRWRRKMEKINAKKKIGQNRWKGEDIFFWLHKKVSRKIKNEELEELGSQQIIWTWNCIKQFGISWFSHPVRVSDRASRLLVIFM